jgi:hypothetical protein
MQRRHRRENHDGAVEAAGRRRWCGREGLSTTEIEVYIVEIFFGLGGVGRYYLFYRKHIKLK